MAGRKGSTTNRITDLSDAIDKDLRVVSAIMDAAKVLTALEHAQAKAKDGTLQTGDGYANGHVLRDDSLPDLLSHGTALVERIENAVARIYLIARAERESLRAVANG